MTATGNLMTMLTRTQECVVHDLTGAGKAGVTRGSVSEASCIGADGPTVPKGLVPAAPDSQTISGARKADVICQTPEDEHGLSGRDVGSLGQAVYKKPEREGSSEPRRRLRSQSTKPSTAVAQHAPARDSQTPSKPLRIDGNE